MSSDKRTFKHNISASFYMLRFDDYDQLKNIIRAHTFDVHLKPGHDIFIDIYVKPQYYEVIEENIRYKFDVFQFDSKSGCLSGRFLVKPITTTQHWNTRSVLMYTTDTYADGSPAKVAMVKQERLLTPRYPFLPQTARVKSYMGIYWPEYELDDLKPYWDHLSLGVPIKKKHIAEIKPLGGDRCTAEILPQYRAFPDHRASFVSAALQVKGAHVPNFQRKDYDSISDDAVLFYIRNPRQYYLRHGYPRNHTA